MPGEGDGPRLKRIRIEGFQSIAAQEIEFSDLDVLIGPNGAGKSNLIAFLRMVGFMLSSDTGLGLFVGLAGGAAALLHDGPKITDEIAATIVIETPAGTNEYVFRLRLAPDDSLIFAEERIRFSQRGRDPQPNWLDFGAGHRAPRLLLVDEDPARKTQRTILSIFRGLAVYQFHDTSPAAPPKRKSSVDSGRSLRGDAGNLAAFLLRMRGSDPAHYDRIVKTVRLIVPFFGDFVLEPDQGYVLLCWREIGSDQVFGPGQISDGTLRMLASVALLLQPLSTMAPILVIDEPELGLHPVGLDAIAGLVRAASHARQCIVATQSPAFLVDLEPENLVIVERVGRASTFRRLDRAELDVWLEDYNLAELWETNLLGGRPHAVAAE